ncbi:MAG: tetratricopeptide repeat protein [Myxococcales bacterium]
MTNHHKETGFSSLLADVRKRPDDLAGWDELEAYAASEQTPEPVAEAYAEILARDLPLAVAKRLGEHALRFCEEWFADETPLMQAVLLRVFDRDPADEAVFDRLSMGLTATGSWERLLEVYEKAVDATDSLERRIQLLDDAVRVAKDLAHDTDRAIVFMKRLVPLRPSDNALRSALERLLERGERWRELIALWDSGTQGASPETAARIKVQIASCWLDRLKNAPAALEVLRKVLENGPGHVDALALSERLLGSEDASTGTRREVLDLLRKTFLRGNRPLDVARVVRASLSFAQGQEREQLHREAAKLWLEQGAGSEALSDLGELFVLRPEDEQLASESAELSSKLGEQGRWVGYLERAAQHTSQPVRAAQLRLRAATLAHDPVGDTERAIALCERVFLDDAESGLALDAGRALDALLEANGRHAARLSVLERLARLETDVERRREVLGALARLASTQGAGARAVSTWLKRLEEDPQDREALDGLVELYEGSQDYRALVDVLRRRVALKEGAAGGRDLARIAEVHSEALDEIESALKAWGELHSVAPDLVAALHVGDLLQRAATREGTRTARVLCALGDAYRVLLGEAERALFYYARALASDASLAAAQTGLGALLENDAVRAGAADALAGAYASTENSEGLLSLLPHRLFGASTPSERARLLRQAAMLEERKEQSARAFAHLCAALVEDPESSANDSDLRRLAQQEAGWQALADAALSASGKLAAESPRVAQLRALEGEIAERALDDSGRALEAYSSALRVSPTDTSLARTVVRVGAARGEYKLAFEVVLAAAQKADQVPDELLALIEAQVEGETAYRGLTRAAEESLESARLNAPVKRELATRIAGWQEKHCQDLEAAQSLLQKAYQLGAPHAETLRRLITVQRREPGQALFGSLMALAELSQEEFAALIEAQELARDVLRDGDLERRVLGLTFRRSATALLQGQKQVAGLSLEQLANGSALRIAELSGEAGDVKTQVQVLREASQLPIDSAFARELAERAAAIASARLGDATLAAALYQRALEQAPDSTELLAALAVEYDKLGRLEELLVLRRRELALTSSVARRLELRLDIARVMAEIEARGGRFGALRDNLRDAPGHEPSLLALEAALRERGALLDVHELFASQAAQLEGLGDSARAAQLWSSAARLSDQELGLPEKALFAYQRVCDLAENNDALDSLARIRLARNEHAQAVPWLARRLERMTGDERVGGVLRLARAYQQAADAGRAIDCLVRGVGEAPDASELRDLLSDLYRKTGRVGELAPLLAENALRATDKTQVLACAREAAELFCGPCGQPERAVAVLSRAVEMDPEDRTLKCLYADALVAAGRLPEAQAVLDGMIAAFGRRRSVERAEVHLRLSRVAQAAGNLEEALAQLDTASSMDRSHTGILRALGELSYDSGQLDRAERAYRALLMALKKPQPGVVPEVGVAEVLYQLHRIAAQLEQSEKAAELLESAVQTAVHSEDETARLKQLLAGRGDPALLLRVLELRLIQVSDPIAEAAARSDLADVLELVPERKAEALEERLRALSCAPDHDPLHRKALALAEAGGEVRKYAEAVRSLYERARRKEDLGLASDLALRAASVYEHALGDLTAAEAQYKVVREDAPGFVEAQFSLARVAGKLGHADEERAVLSRIVELPEDPAHANSKRSARYRLAELLIEAPSTRDEGFDVLVGLLKEMPDHARAGSILQAACSRDPKDVRALELLEQNARKSDEPGLLLDFVERHAKSQEPSLGLIREGAELALRIQENARAEALLRRAIKLAEKGEGLIEALWAPIALGRLRNQLNDVAGAIDWLERAMKASDSYEAFELGLEVGALAEGRGKDPERAIRIYEALRERDPADRRVWSALLALYKKGRNLDGALGVVRTTLEALIDPAERNALRMETAKLLLESNREDDGRTLLQEVLGEDPDNEEAALLLADLYERNGENEAMAELLGRKLESARERRSLSLVPISLRMGHLLEETRPEQAVEIYREGLALLPDSYDLMRATLSMLDPERDAVERANLLERYLSGDGREDEHALGAALWLLEYQTQTGDEAAFERALAIAYRVSPGHDEIRSRLEQWYRQRNDFANLALMLEQEAGRAEDPNRAFALLVEVADIRLHKLAQPSEAAALLRRARAYSPNDFELLKRAVLASAASGELGPALAEIDQALEERSRKKSERVELLLLRAEVAGAAGMHDEAVEALDKAHQYAGQAVLGHLMTGLEQARLGSQASANVHRERELTLRLVDLQSQAGAVAEASELLIAWVARAPRDVEALRILIELLGSAERWTAVIGVAESLLREDEPEVLPAVSERLVIAARALGRPELARKGLERALERAPEQLQLVDLLSELYAELSEKQALAELMLRYLSPQDPAEKRFEQLRRIGQLLLDAGDSERALAALTQAWELKPDDMVTVLFIADAQIAARRFQEAQDLLEKAMNACKSRRSPELAQLRYRMAKLSSAAGDSQARLEWLNSALEADMNNGDVASELAVVAQNMNDLDTALKALRAITMLKTDAPMTRAEAFYRQAVIVAQKGEPRRAVLWAKKAKAENANFPGVDALLAELGEAS